jgi:V-type H+-transporting ATPase subunit H
LRWFRAEKYEKCHKHAREFLNWLMQQSNVSKLRISVNAYTFALMILLKTNELAREFTTPASFRTISDLLEGPCLENPQVSYNVVTMLWVLSYHDFTHKHFEDYTLAIIEKVSKILDFFSWEKLARITLMLFDNLKEVEVCQEHLSDIDALNLIVKLQNRHWVDTDINKMLDTLFEYFDGNQKVFSSIEKLRNQVNREQLRWGPCHTTKFWQENCVLFDKQENLHLIDTIVNRCLLSANDRVKAVACFDLGEFARYYHHGREFLERLNVKEKVSLLMRDPETSAELKKEAITCY